MFIKYNPLNGERRKDMKHTKLFSILLASALALSLTACAGTPATSSSELPDSSASQPESSASQSESSVAESSASA